VGKPYFLRFLPSWDEREVESHSLRQFRTVQPEDVGNRSMNFDPLSWIALWLPDHTETVYKEQWSRSLVTKSSRGQFSTEAGPCIQIQPM
jgi:hypothetical protein